MLHQQRLAAGRNAPCFSAGRPLPVPPCLMRGYATPSPSYSDLAAAARPLSRQSQRRRVRMAFKPSPMDAAQVLDSVASTDVSNISMFDDENLYDTSSQCPHGNVIGIMRSMEKEPGQCSWPQQVFTAYPDESLQSIIPRLNKVTGLPVIDRVHGKVMGVISRKDVIKVRNARGSMAETVAQHMTSPAIVIVSSASVQQAADLMLSRKIRRLPVVDEDGYAVGIVSRSDIFKPLFRDAYNLYMEKEKAALQEIVPSPSPHHLPAASVSSTPGGLLAAAAGVGLGVASIPAVVEAPRLGWKLKYLYDGDCPMCSSLMNVLQRQDNGRGLIEFVNIADEDYEPRNHMGIAYEEAMETIHAIDPDGSVIQGTEALKQLFSTVGLGWAVQLSDLPFFSWLVDVLYQFLSANRLSLGGALDGIIAAKRMDLSKKGVETCGDVDEQCEAEW